MVILAVSILFAFTYLWLQLYYVYHWLKIPVITVPENYEPAQGVSIVVVAHNEEKSIEACILSILQQDYPSHLIDLIIIDDRSTDQTTPIINQIIHSSLRIFHLSDFPQFIHAPAFKKSGIELGVHHAKHDLIVVTDADCLHQQFWLKTIAYTQEKLNANFLTGPVLIMEGRSMLIKMQQMENLVFMLITAAGIKSHLHDIANGANMVFKKKSFLDADPYKDNYQFASGDDLFLIEKMRQRSGKITFIKSKQAVITTSGKKDWNSLLKQRIRWAGKNKGLQNQTISRIWSFVGLYHFVMLILFICGFFFPVAWVSLGIMFLIKSISDYILLRTSSRFFGVMIGIAEFILLQFTYMYYVLRLGWSLLLGRKGDW